MDHRLDRADAVEGARFAAFQAQLGTFDAKLDKMSRRLMSGLVTIVGAVIIKVFLG